MRWRQLTSAALLAPVLLMAGDQKKDKAPPKAPPPSPLDVYVQQATNRAKSAGALESSPGSLWSPSSGLADLARDNRASQVDDIVTVLVSETTSAVADGGTKTARASAASSSISALAGIKSSTGSLANLLGVTGNQSLNGTGTTSRDTTLTTNISARVVAVLPNGYLVVDAVKEVQVDSEKQLISIRGVVRPADITTANTVSSNQVAEMEIRVNGKGVIADSIHRPNVLYRILLGLLPF
jgi:flagellar L-ring protein precursor FlgH